MTLNKVKFYVVKILLCLKGGGDLHLFVLFYADGN